MTDLTAFARAMRQHVAPYIHLDDEAASLEHQAAITDIITKAGAESELLVIGTCHILAGIAGAALRAKRDASRDAAIVNGHFGVLPDPGIPPLDLQADQIIVAAANNDLAMLRDLLLGIVPNAPEEASMALLQRLLTLARRLHRDVCRECGGPSL